MTDRGDAAKAASRIIRERAMAILRDTRSRIDPALLAAMKEKLSAHAHSEPRSGKTPPPLKEGLFKRDYKDSPAEKPQSASAPYPAGPEPVADENGMVPVDRQKVAQIVLQYMKNREEKQKH